MNNNIILFLMIFIIVFIGYEICLKRDYKKSLKNIKKKRISSLKYPVEVRLLRDFYKIELDNIDYKLLLNIVCFVSSIDITIIVMISGIFDRGYLQILVAFLLVVPIIFLSYYLVALFYRKKNRRKK